MTFAQELKQMMDSYDRARAEWIKTFGDDRGFNEWVMKVTSDNK